MDIIRVKLEGGKTYLGEVMKKHVRLENLSVFLILFIAGGGHVSDDVEELGQQLKSGMEVFYSLVLLLVLPKLIVQSGIQEFEVRQLQTRPNRCN